MKKLFSLGTVFLLAFGLTACTDDAMQSRIDELERELESHQDLVDEVVDWADYAASLENEIDVLEGEIDALEGQLMPINITVSVMGLNGIRHTKMYGFNSESLPTMVELLTMGFDADILSSEYGNFIAGIGDLDVPYGAYIAIIENNEMSMVGIDDLILSDGDHFRFEVTWWDPTQEAVYEAIELFMANQVPNYISTEYIDYNVLLGCMGLQLCSTGITEAGVSAYVEGLTLVTVQDYFKAIMIANTLSDPSLSETLMEELLSVVETGAYGQTALGLIALDSVDYNLDYSDYVTAALNYYLTSTPYDEGLDAGGFGVIALSQYSLETGIQSLIDDYVDWVIADQLPSGGIKTRDIVWNDTTYPGTENAATIAMVILALIANDLDPASGEFLEGTNNLILRLIEFQTADGTFDWDLSDEISNDPAFSTPQAILALATYYKYMNSYGAYTNPYID